MVTITISISAMMLMPSRVAAVVATSMTVKMIRTFTTIILMIASPLLTMQFTQVTMTVVTRASRVGVATESIFTMEVRASIGNQDGHSVQGYSSEVSCATKCSGIVQCAKMLKDLRDGVRISLERELLLERWHQLPIAEWEHFGQLTYLIEYVEVWVVAENTRICLFTCVPLLLGLLQGLVF